MVDVVGRGRFICCAGQNSDGFGSFVPELLPPTLPLLPLLLLFRCSPCFQDYTGSNRDPRDPQSLHYMHPSGALTQYEQAISGVGRVLEMYDNDKVSECTTVGLLVSREHLM